jgi:hypothetical protein
MQDHIYEISDKFVQFLENIRFRVFSLLFRCIKPGCLLLNRGLRFLL